MPEPVVVEAAPGVVKDAPPATPSAKDLIQRTATTVVEKKPDDNGDGNAHEHVSLSLDDVTDPKAKELLQAKLKEANRAIGSKFEEAARLRKDLESERSRPWTPERIQELIKDPNWRSAAVTALEARAKTGAPSAWEGTDEQWSALNDDEKKAFRALEDKVTRLESDQVQRDDATEHEQVKSEFADYDADKVKSFQRDIMEGRVSQLQIKRLIWQAINFERYLEQSYKFGLEDRNGNLKTKLNGSSTTTGSGASTETDEGLPTKKEGESNRSFFKRVAEYRLEQNKSKAGAGAR